MPYAPNTMHSHFEKRADLITARGELNHARKVAPSQTRTAARRKKTHRRKGL